MDYQSYNKMFLQMQKDYMQLNDLITKLKTSKLEAYVTESGQAGQYEEYKKQYAKLNTKIYATAVSLKEYFV